MTAVFLYLIFLAVVYRDARALQNADTPIYRRTLRAPPMAWVALVGLLLPIALIYWSRRAECLRRLAVSADVVPPPQPQFDVAREAAGVLILWFVIGVPVGGLAFWLLSESGELLKLLVSSILADVIFVALLFAALRRRPGGDPWQVAGWRGGRFTVFGSLVVGATLGAGHAGVVAYLISQRADARETLLSSAVAGAGLPDFIGFLLIAGLVGPFVEELVFRGYLFRVFEVLRGPIVAFFAISLLFALLHLEQNWGDPIVFGSVLVASFLFSGLRLASGWTLASTAAHYAYNFGVFVLPIALLYVNNPSWAAYHYSDRPDGHPIREELLIQALEEQPENHQAMNELAWIYATEDRQLDRAFELIERALDLAPNKPAYVGTRAEILFRLGHREQAIATELWLVERYPDVPLYRQQLERFRGGAPD